MQLEDPSGRRGQRRRFLWGRGGEAAVAHSSRAGAWGATTLPEKRGFELTDRPSPKRRYLQDVPFSADSNAGEPAPMPRAAFWIALAWAQLPLRAALCAARAALPRARFWHADFRAGSEQLRIAAAAPGMLPDWAAEIHA